MLKTESQCLKVFVCLFFVFLVSPLLRCPLCELLLWVVSCQLRSTWCLGARENRYAPHCRLSEVVPYAVLPLKQLLSDVCFPSSVGSSVWSGPSSLHTQCSLSVPDLKPNICRKKIIHRFQVLPCYLVPFKCNRNAVSHNSGFIRI